MNVSIKRKCVYWIVVLLCIIVVPSSLFVVAKASTDQLPSSHFSRLSLSAQALFFDRVGTANYTLVERVPGTTYFFDIPSTGGTPALCSRNLKQGFAPGFALGADCCITDHYNVLASFFRIGRWHAVCSVGPDSPLDWLVMRAPGGFFQTQDFTYQSMTWNYCTQLNNAELNLQKKFSSGIRMLAGFRWLQLHENLQGTIPPPDRIQPLWKNYPEADMAYVAWFEKQPGVKASLYPPFWNTCVTNNLYGIQLGALGELFSRDRFCCDGVIKIGGYVNRAIESTGVSIAKVVYDSCALANHGAFVGEIDLQFSYQCAQWMSLKFGYDLLLVTGVALAPGQIQKTYSSRTSVQALGVYASSYVFFNGAHVGVELSF